MVGIYYNLVRKKEVDEAFFRQQEVVSHSQILQGGPVARSAQWTQKIQEASGGH